ncbi:MAG: PepSY domain-containing protein [Acidimicrobiia bacterium]
MNRRLLTLIAALGVLGLIAGGVTAVVAGAQGEPEVTITEENAIKAATAIVPGEVVQVELDDDGTPVAYEVEIVDKDGTQWEVLVDASTGNVIGEPEVDDDTPGAPDEDEDDD